MNSVDITNLRLRNQYLTGKPLATAPDVVRMNGAVQAQDSVGARWAVGQRTRRCMDADVLRAYDEGAIVRTHIMRPTWHFVAPEDLRWMQALTSPRVHAVNAYRYRQLEIDPSLARKAKGVMTRALRGGNYLTRTQVATRLQEAGIATDGQRLAYLMMWAELDALICSGPMRGKQTTYALVHERVGATSREFDREGSLRELILRFFNSHGPAQIRDFVFWSGLTVAEAKRGIGATGGDLNLAESDGEVYYFTGPPRAGQPTVPLVHLLPNYDEYLLAYRDGRHAGGAVDMSGIDVDDLSAHFVLLDGHVVGGWRRNLGAKGIEARVWLFVRLDAGAREALGEEFERYAAFVGVPVNVTYR